MLLIDGSNLLFRQMFVPELFQLKDANGHITGGIHGFFNSLGNLTKRFNREHAIIVAWDKGKSDYRTSIYPEYKAQRTRQGPERDDGHLDDGRPSHEEILASYKWSRDLLHNKLLPLAGVVTIMVPGVEADDILAWICRRMKVEQSKIIVSTDKDLLQLVSGRVRVFNPLKKNGGDEKPGFLYRKDQVIEEWKLMPEKFRDHFMLTRALIGDVSDNIPGIEGIGEKTAPDIAAILLEKGVDGLNPKLKRHAAVISGQDIIQRNLKLIDLRLLDKESRKKIRRSVKLAAMVKAGEDSASALSEAFDDFDLHQAKASIRPLIEANADHDIRKYLREAARGKPRVKSA